MKIQLNPDFSNSQGTDKVVRKIEVQFNPDFSNSDKIVKKIGGLKNRMIQKKWAD